MHMKLEMQGRANTCAIALRAFSGILLSILSELHVHIPHIPTSHPTSRTHEYINIALKVSKISMLKSQSTTVPVSHSQMK